MVGGGGGGKNIPWFVRLYEDILVFHELERVNYLLYRRTNHDGTIFLAHRIRICACFTWTDNSISPMFSHPGPDKNHVILMHWLYRKSRISSSGDVVFFNSRLRQK